MADEILAYSDYRNRNMAMATQEFDALANDPGASGELKARAHAMADFLKQGGDKNFGTVPPPALMSQPGAATPPPGAPSKP